MDTPTLTISQELFNPKGLLEKLPDFTKAVREFLTNYRISDTKPFATLSFKPLKGKLDKMPYAQMRAIEVSVPPGLISPYLAYLHDMEDAVEMASRLNDDVLQPFQRWLAVKLTNPEQLANLRSGKEIQGFKPHNVEAMGGKLGKHFKTGSNVSKVPYSKVVQRHRDLEAAVDQINEINSKFMATNRKKIKESITYISGQLDLLFQRIHENPTEYSISDANLRVLSALCRSMAEEIEFYTAVGYQLGGATEALHDTLDTIEKVTRGRKAA